MVSHIDIKGTGYPSDSPQPPLIVNQQRTRFQCNMVERIQSSITCLALYWGISTILPLSFVIKDWIICETEFPDCHSDFVFQALKINAMISCAPTVVGFLFPKIGREICGTCSGLCQCLRNRCRGYLRLQG